jgi:hypothetical protein
MKMQRELCRPHKEVAFRLSEAESHWRTPRRETLRVHSCRLNVLRTQWQQ